MYEMIHYQPTMKAMQMIGAAIEGDGARDAKLPGLALKMLTEAFAKIRGDHPQAMLVVEHAPDGRPVYITIGSYPPELQVGDQKAYGVCSPAIMQDPIATFIDKEKATAWAESTAEGDYRIVELEVGATTVPRVAVASLVVRDGKTLLGRLESGTWTLPEALLQMGEALDGAAQRALASTTGLIANRVAVSRAVPYVNTYFADLGRHYMTIVMCCEATGDPAIVDPRWVEWGWFDTQAAPPKPLLPSVEQMMTIAKRFHLELVPPPPPAPPPPVTEVRAASVPSRGKRPRPRRSRSR